MDNVTGSDATDKLLYTYMGLRLLVYLFFFILNSYQSIIEGKASLQNRNKMNTRFFIFISLSTFCAFRVISTALFYKYNNLAGFLIKSLPFLFFTLGTTAIFMTWIFILHFWLLIMYSFFVTDEIRIGRTKPINWTTAIFVTVLIVYQATISALGMVLDIKFGQAVGFLLLLAVYCILVFSFGSVLLKHLKQHKKDDSPFDHYNDMIKKTKILLYTAIIIFILVLAEEIIYAFAFPVSLSNSIQANFILFLIDTSQMLVVMYVLANGKFSNYLIFKRVKTTSYNSEKTSTDEAQLKPKKSFSPHFVMSGPKHNSPDINNQQDNNNNSIDMDNFTNSSTIDITISDGSGKGIITNDFSNSSDLFDSSSNLN